MKLCIDKYGSMKKFTGFISLAILIITIVNINTGCNKDENTPPAIISTTSDSIFIINNELFRQQVNSLPKENLVLDETESILLMREEEKMARDAYIVFYQKWNLPIFSNISGAEQTHMDAVLLLINKYSLTDPVGPNPAGIFVNSDIQALYNEFIKQGNQSYQQALMAGAAIEEVDIRDLQYLLNEENIDNQDIELVYTNLLKGSRNHLRSFVKVLKNYGIVYSPEYLDQAVYNEIINSPMESGR
jgi:hypothetical protein